MCELSKGCSEEMVPDHEHSSGWCSNLHLITSDCGSSIEMERDEESWDDNQTCSAGQTSRFSQIITSDRLNQDCHTTTTIFITQHAMNSELSLALLRLRTHSLWKTWRIRFEDAVLFYLIVMMCFQMSGCQPSQLCKCGWWENCNILSSKYSQSGVRMLQWL